MRNSFVDTLCQSAEADPQVFLIVGDLGYSVVETFSKKFPDRFLNAGVAEQNMTGLAAGLAMTGFKVFTYSIANFSTLRCLEQIRNDICYHSLDVTIVSVGAGVAYGAAGYSHHAVQDLACMRSFPEMTLLTPYGPGDARRLTRWACKNPGPKYLRLGKGGEREFSPIALSDIDSRVVQLRAGESIAVFIFGPQIQDVLPWADHHNAAVYAVSRWSQEKGIASELTALTAKYSRVLIVEEHFRAGGCGSFFLEIMEQERENIGKIRIVSLDSFIRNLIGSSSYLKKVGGLTDCEFDKALSSYF